MIPEWGLFCVILAGCLILSGLIRPRLDEASRRWAVLCYGQGFFLLLAMLTLVWSFLKDDFSVRYVAMHSHTDLPSHYKACAIWAGHEGSLLLWSVILSLWTVAVSAYCQMRRVWAGYANRVLSILSLIQMGFLTLLLTTAHPFMRWLPFHPPQGQDLNPLLQDIGFVFHPPFLYLGYVGFAVPFAFAVAALWWKEKPFAWISIARPWTLLAWSFLTVGITLGSWWAYYELGWGGWWFWDPVENASFMPWLSATALVHALEVAFKRKQFTAWAALLAMGTFLLSLVGAFLVRSGILSSVHAFASSPFCGMFILVFFGIVFLACAVLYFKRAFLWANPAPMGFFSRESFVSLGTVLLTTMMFTILLGTFYPLIAQHLFGEKLSVGAPYFNWVFFLLLIPILLLMSIATHLPWANIKKPNMKKSGLKLIAAIVGLMILKCYFSNEVAVGLLFSIILAFSLLKKMPKRLGSIPMWIAHAGIGVMVTGACLVNDLQVEKELTMKPGQSIVIKDYLFTFKEIKPVKGANFESEQGTFSIEKQGKVIAHLYPEKRFFPAREWVMTETAIKAYFFQDFYIALGENLGKDEWSVRIYIKPFVRCIWLGGLSVALGAALCAVRRFYKTEPLC